MNTVGAPSRDQTIATYSKTHNSRRSLLTSQRSIAYRPRNRRSSIVASADDPTGSAPLQMINRFSVAVTNFSPANAVKKAIANLQAGQYDETAVQSKLENYIKDNPVVVFSWTRCPFCVKAKKELDSLNAKYLAVELDTMPDGNAIRAELAKKTDRTSMPNIFIAGQGIGGCNDGPGLLTLQREGRLMPLLKAAGAI